VKVFTTLSRVGRAAGTGTGHLPTERAGRAGSGAGGWGSHAKGCSTCRTSYRLWRLACVLSADQNLYRKQECFNVTIAALPCRARWPAWRTSRASRWPAWRPRRPPALPRCAPRPPRCPSRCARPPRAAWAWPAAARPRWRPLWPRRWPRAAAGRSRWPGRTPPHAPLGTARVRAPSSPGPAPPGAGRTPCS